MTMEYLLTDYANLTALKLRFFDGSNPDMLKQILGSNEVNSITGKFLKDNNICNQV